MSDKYRKSKDPEYIKAYAHKYYEEHKDAIKAKARKYNAEHREQHKEYQRKHRYVLNEEQKIRHRKKSLERYYNRDWDEAERKRIYRKNLRTFELYYQSNSKEPIREVEISMKCLRELPERFTPYIEDGHEVSTYKPPFDVRIDFTHKQIIVIDSHYIF